MRAWVTVALAEGELTITSNVDNSNRIALLEAAKFTVLTQATKPSVAPEKHGDTPDLIQGANTRKAPGLNVRTVA